MEGFIGSLFLTLVVVILFYVCLGKTRIRVPAPNIRDNLPRKPKREQIIAQATAHWKGREVSLKSNGTISACIGSGLYIWHDSGSAPHIICGNTARRFLAEAYSCVKNASGLSEYDCAMMKLQNMNWYSSKHYVVEGRIVGRSRSFRAVESKPIPGFSCELDCCKNI